MQIFNKKLLLTTLMTGLIGTPALADVTIKNEAGLVVTLRPNTQGQQKFSQSTHQTLSALASTSYTSSNQPQTSSLTTTQEPNSQVSYSDNLSSRNTYDYLIREAAARHGVDPGLVKAIMHTESQFKPRVRSRAGAMGLMQLMPATARAFGVRNAYDPAQNIEGGVKVLAWLQNNFDNPDHVIAAYNAGPGNVRKYGGIPPFRETQNYVKKVNERYNNIYRLDASLYVGYDENRTQLAMNSTPQASTTITQTIEIINTDTNP